MNCALPTLLQAIRRSLRDTIATELSSDHARGQLAAIDDVLSKLERMAVWSPDAFSRQAQVLRAGSEAFTARAHAAGLAPPLLEPPPADAAPEQCLRALEAHAMQLTDWLFELTAASAASAASTSSAAPAVHAELHTLLLKALAQPLLIERRLIPLTDFAAMTSASTPTSTSAATPTPAPGTHPN